MTTVNCKEAMALMSAAVDGELCSREQESFNQHIMWCVRCAHEFQEAKKTKRIIREKIVRFNAPQSLVNSILKLTESPS
ncbi:MULTISPECIES: zf-HC2 domain-containing protein [Prosthecochloris]|uniref:Transmembrane anti-sigma factor n=1 Tax=Prosthecochloris aestuarii (strain DSM 271 / SK 413) TaxID=290512 RepID=B4S6Q0_PROA2|nr:putative transmembrane anti-sigma factor [Prosthecochloris aestuarii DSM 271]RDD30679.1 anti-sigma factor [Prosthecochloris sp. ZM]